MAHQPNSYKKFVASAATATLVATALIPAASAAETKSFTDVSKNYKEAVDYLVANKIAGGTTDTTFGTTQNISRGDAAVMIANALKLDTANAKDAGFQDVNARVAGAVNAIVAEGIASGKTSTSFDPAAYITRQEMAKMLANAYKLTAKENASFKDVNSNWIGYVSALKENGITLGKTETTFAPTANLSRGEFALFVFRAEVPTQEIAGAISLTATSSKTLKVQFDKMVDPTTAKFEVKKAGITTNVSKVTFSDDRKSATLELSAKLSEGEYTVNATGVGEKTLTATYKAANERVEKIEILSTTAAVDKSVDPTKATVAYKVSNQYGEDVSKTRNLTTNSPSISAANGIVTITLSGEKIGAKVAVTLIDVESAKNTTAVVELSAAAMVSDVTIDGVYNKDKKELNEDTKLATDEFYLLVDAKDQYGNAVTDLTKLKDGFILSETNPTVIATGTVANKTTFATVTVDGKTRTAIKLVEPKNSNGDPLGLRAGETTVTMISTTTGKNQSYTVKVAEATRADVVTLAQPDLVVAGEDAFIPANALDKKGNAITDVKLLNNAAKGILVTANGTKAEFVLKDGAVMVKVPKAALSNAGIVSVIAQSSTYKVATLTLTVKEAAKASVIRGVDKDFGTTLKQGQVVNVKASNLVVEDQYGRVMTDSKLTGTTKVVVTEVDDNNNVLTVTDTINATTTATVTAAANAKGTAKVQLAISVDGKVLNSSAVDVTFRVTDGKEYASYKAEEVGTVYDVKAKAGNTVADAYDAELVVYGVLADGSKVELDAGKDFTVTASNAGVQTALADGVIKASESFTIDYAKDKNDAAVTLNVTINATGQQFKQEVIFSKVAPTATTVNVKNGTATVTTLSIAKDTFSSAVLAEAGYALEVKDQYGAKAASGKFADGSALNAPKMTIVPVTGTPTITGNGTDDAKVTGLKDGNAFDVTFTYTGGATKTVRVNVAL
ncbi:S-layer homology domain-containing protein [Sporosarcina sp. BP05]|uniref:S-layer homology domain-containing protein n=1 Tax=Sporosarcina sp. BP05 TaxID=2758726 RepID=UPI0016450178|nr:S-layer homology domain-containing protein [Sporosarcina sp. BP05]